MVPSDGGDVNQNRDSLVHGVISGKPGKGRKEERVWKSFEISEMRKEAQLRDVLQRLSGE